MSNLVNSYTTARMTFELFVQARGWQWLGFRSNPKNPSQHLGQCVDQNAEEYYFLITQSGKYFRLLGDKKYEEYDYVYNPDKEGDHIAATPKEY